MASSCGRTLVMLIVANVLIGCHGQFKIVGLLSDEAIANPSAGHQTNAQPRTFSDISAAEVAAKLSAEENNLIKVHVMDPEEPAVQSDDLVLVDNSSDGQIESSSTTEVVVPVVKVSPTVPAVTSEAEKKKSRKYRPNLARLRKLSLDASHNSILFYRNNAQPFYQNHAADLKFNRISKYRNRYKTKCRCSSITNCPKLQITVARCEPNLFLCCFD